MCVLSYRAQSRWWYLEKSVFLKYLLIEQHKKPRKNQAESFDFSTIYQKIRNEKAQRSTILEGEGSFVPPPPSAFSS